MILPIAIAAMTADKFLMELIEKSLLTPKSSLV
jgi:hypothetical protein